MVAGAVRLRAARPGRAAGPHPAAIHLRERRAGRRQGVEVGLCPRRRVAPGRGAACRARLLPHDDPAHHAGVAGAAARGACQERQDADLSTPTCWSATGGPSPNLKVSSIHAPMGFHHQVSLDFPVSLGGYRHPRDPTEPMLLHLVHVPGAPNQGLDARAQFRIGQGKLYAMTFADFEERIRDDLDRMLGPGGFSTARATSRRSPSTAGRTATAMWPTRCSIPEDYDDTVLKARAADVAATSPSPTPTPAATPGCTSPSTRRSGR